MKKNGLLAIVWLFIAIFSYCRMPIEQRKSNSTMFFAWGIFGFTFRMQAWDHEDEKDRK